MHLVSLFKLSCGRVLLAGTLCLCGSACVAQTQLALATVAATSPLRAKASPAAAAAAAAAAAEVAALPDAPVSQLVQSQSVDVTQTAPPASQTPANAPATQQQQEQLSREEQAARDVKAQEHQRILGIMPAFNSTSNQNAVPLTASQKIQLSFRSAVDPWQFGITVVASALGQAENSHPGYGQGWEGYGKRYAASYGDLFDGTIIGNGLLPALLHQDPRYFRKGTGSKWHRFFYAASTNIICKGDNGKWQPNYSNVGGNLISGGISEFYYPKQEQDVGLLFSNAATVTLEGAIGSELLEFWPDIHRKLFKNKTDSYTQAADEAQKKGGATPPATSKQQVQPAEPK